MKAFVTGGAGFIGSHLVDALVSRGDQVVVLDDLSSGREQNLAEALSNGARLLTGDVTDAPAVNEAVAELDPDLVFHLAAQVDVRVSVVNPGRDVRVNVEGAVNVLEAARRAGASSFVLASSCAVYGEPEHGTVPLNEAASLHPGSPYGQAKLSAEGYLATYRQLHGMRAASLRFGNVYGPRQSSIGEAGVVSIFCRQLRDGERPKVFGSGEQTRDFVFVGDVVRALIAAADRQAIGEINVGTGTETSVLELIAALRTIGGRSDFIAELEPPRAGEIDRMALDPSFAAAQLGWHPSTPLRKGLETTWRAAAD